MKHRTLPRCLTCVRRSATFRTGLCSACYQQKYRGGIIGKACDGCGIGDTRVVGTGKLRAELHRRPLCANCRYLGRACRTLDDLQASVAEGREPITSVGAPAPA